MLTLRLIGTPSLGREGDTSPLVLERKDAALLGVLALDGPTARDSLALMLWPDVPLKTANNSFRQRVFRLRRRLDHAVVQTGDLVALCSDVAVDVLASLAADDCARSMSGELLGSFNFVDCEQLSEWVRVQRERWRAKRRDLATAAAARHEAAGELARAIELTELLVAEDPLLEHAHRRLMRLHYLRGDRAAAIRVFEAFERTLKDELGTRPDRETQELVATIENSALAPALRRGVVPASLRRPPRLIGRSRELAALDRAWASDHIFLLLGEAGMGKSRLLQEFSAMHSRAVCVQARPGDAGVPFALLGRLLRAVNDRAVLTPDESTRRELARVLPEFGAGLIVAGEGQRLLLQGAIETLLAQAHAAGLEALLLDDLHFADDASLDMLQPLLFADRLARLRWGMAQREADTTAAGRALRNALEESQRLAIVTLAPLTVAEMEALIASLGLPEVDAAQWAAPLVRHTGGNPLFALETMKDMVLTGVDRGGGRLPQPTTVGALIERRLRQLSPAALALARVAAIAGVDFSIELAEHVVRTPAIALTDAWAELESAQVMTGTVFAHDLVFEAMLRSVPQPIS